MTDLLAQPLHLPPWSLAVFHAADDRAVHADVWERHTEADEVLCVLSGAVRVHFRDADQGTPSAPSAPSTPSTPSAPTAASSPVATLGPGDCFVVPVGQWHRLSVDEPGDLLAISPRSGTEHTPVSAGAGEHLAPAKGEGRGEGTALIDGAEGGVRRGG